jgi:hypothetical protein
MSTAIAQEVASVYVASLTPALPSTDLSSSFAAVRSRLKYNSKPANNGEGPAGTVSFSETFCNTSSMLLSGLYTETTAITSGANLISRTVGSTNPGRPGGPGSQQMLPPYTAAVPGIPPGGCLKVRYQIGLAKKSRSVNFDFLIYGHPTASD